MTTAKDSPDRLSTWEQNHDATFDGAESRPPASSGCWETSAGEFVGDNNYTLGPRTSVSSVSVAAETSEASKPMEEGAPAGGEEQSRPTDDEIIGYENWIKEQEAEKIPFVGNSESLTALESEYTTGSQVFVQKIRTLEQTYGSIRRARGDGNCFFRSFIFAYLENLVNANDLAERDRMMALLEKWRKQLTDCGFQELVFEDALDVILSQLQQIGGDEPLSLEILEINMRDSTVSNMIVMFLRMLTSAEIQRRDDFFAPFILGMSDDCPTVEVFCRRCVEPMGEESDHVHIVALTDALQVAIRVVYLDNSMALATTGATGGDSAAQVNYHDFVPSSLAGPDTAPVLPKLNLLYRPGHYDILYRK